MDKAGDLARDALAGMVPGRQRAEVEACLAWPKIAGPEIAPRTWPLRLRGGTLLVATSNAAWATELGYLSEELRDKLNAALGADTVKHLRFVVRPEPHDPADVPGDT